MTDIEVNANLVIESLWPIEDNSTLIVRVMLNKPKIQLVMDAGTSAVVTNKVQI